VRRGKRDKGERKAKANAEVAEDAEVRRGEARRSLEALAEHF
jgi:hypothetical protein